MSSMPGVKGGKIFCMPEVPKTSGVEQARTKFYLENEWEISYIVISHVLDTNFSLINANWSLC